MLERDHAYYRQALAGRPMPLAFVDLDILDRNARDVLTRAGTKPVRIASKSVRSVPVLSRLLASDERFQGLLCFTADEAVWLAGQGFDDLVVAYPTWEPSHVEAVAAAVADGRHIVLMVDSLTHVAHLESLARTRGVRLPLCLDLDLSVDLPGLRFGVYRSPVRGVEAAIGVVERIVASDHLDLDGIMGYEAQIAGVADRLPGQAAKNAVIRLLKRRSIPEVARRRAEVVAAVEQLGVELRFVNGGGTGSLASTARERVVTEVTAGSGFFAPTLFDHYEDFRFLPAAGFAIQIVRRPSPDVYTCLGGGYIASGAVGPDKAPSPYLPRGADLLANEGAGEVQTPVRYRGPVPLQLGDPILMRHAKAGELCERFDRLHVIADGTVVDEYPTYRGEGRTFL